MIKVEDLIYFDGFGSETEKPMRTEVLEIAKNDFGILETLRKDENARFMTEREIRLLKKNIETDGALSSVPLAYPIDGKLRVISGNHRIKASIEVGLDKIYVMVVVSPMSEKDFIRLQLSHNALVGQDDLKMLEELYQKLDIEEKQLSGLSDENFKNLAELSIPSSNMNITLDQYEVLLLFKNKEDVDTITATIEEYSKSKDAVLLLQNNEFDAFIDKMSDAKGLTNIKNASLCLLKCMEIALSSLRENQNKVEPEQGGEV